MKKVILMIISLGFSFNLMADIPCLTKSEASNLVAKQFLDEYFGRVSTHMFSDTFYFYFSEQGSSETENAVKDMFLSMDYEFNGWQHEFISDHILDMGEDEEHIEFAEFNIKVSCSNNRIESKVTKGEFPNF